MSELRRSITGFIFIALAFGMSFLALRTLERHGSLLGGDEVGPADAAFRRILEEGNLQGAFGRGTGTGNEQTQIRLVLLVVSVFENIFGRQAPVKGVTVNITQVKEPVDQGDLRDQETQEDVRIAFGETTDRGQLFFRLPEGNYTVSTMHLALLGNRTVNLVSSVPRVDMRWTFNARSQVPSLIQFADENGDGVISQGESVAIFVPDSDMGDLRTVALGSQGRLDTMTKMNVIRIERYGHGTLLILTPLLPIRLADLANRQLVIIIFSFEVQVRP